MSETIPKKPRRVSLTSNVLSNWFGQLALMVGGFIVPRLLSDKAGPDQLGIWDLGWSLTSFSMLLSLGVSGAVTRYVAHYHALDDDRGMNRMVNSALVLLTASGALAVGLTAIFVAFIPSFLKSADAHNIATARAVVWALGISAAVQFPSGVFNGILGGLQRFDLRNNVRIGMSVGLLIGVVAVLYLGYGVAAVARLVLATEVLTGCLYYVMVHHCWAYLRLGLQFVSSQEMREAITFGGKCLVRDAALSSLYEVNRLVLAYFLAGPMALSGLAIYSRQRGLITIARRFIMQYALVFVPASAALHARGEREKLIALFHKSTSTSFFIILPIMAVLVVLGSPLMRLWMGNGYEQPSVLAILAIGHAAALSQEPTIVILMGIQRPGLASLAALGSLVTGVALSFLFIGVFGWGMVGGALALALPLTLFGGVITPLLACRVLGVAVVPFLWRSVSRPLLAVSPFALWLAAAAWFFETSDLLQLSVGLGGGSLILAPLYWRWVLPDWVKRRILKRAGLRRVKAGTI